MRINNHTNKQNFKSLATASNALGQFYNANATLPTLIIETGVTLGRANEANKRGGKIEATDRLIEQGISAVVWIYGVKALKKIGDLIGEKLLKLDLNFDIGSDELRKPIKYIDKNALGFKAGNILISTALATYFIGAVLPKINNAILKKTLKKENSKKEINDKINVESFEEFKNKTQKNKQISFTSISDLMANSAHVLENNSTARLFITDTGVIAGRFHNAPNKYRKIEGLFRDIASIYFYLKATKDIVGVLNKIFKNTDIDPKALEKTVGKLNEKLAENSNLSNEDFLKYAKRGINSEDLSKLKELFAGKKAINLKDFTDTFAHTEEAKKMSALQFAPEGKELLSFRQAKDVLSPCWINNSEFLKETYDYVTDKDIASKKTFVSSKYLDKTRNSIDNFIQQIYDSAKGQKIDKEFIENIAKKTVRKNLIFNIIGTAISILALGTLIPKIQYAITRKLTNENKFHTEDE